jgi:predicted O-methyltransferase YrrM
MIPAPAAAPPMTRSLVRWAYRLVLGREPESEQVIGDWLGSADVAGLREALLSSPEFAAHAAEGFPERGGWILGPVTEEALAVLLLLRDGEAPSPAAIAALRAETPDLPALRRRLLDSPEFRRRAPQRPRPLARPHWIAGRRVTLHGLDEPAESPPGLDIAARHAALLRAAWTSQGAGRVILDAGAGIGLAALGFALGAPAHAALLAHEPGLEAAAALAANLAGNGVAAARVRAVALDSPEAALAREGLPRLDLLRLGAAEALSEEGAAWARAALAQGALVVLRLDLAAALARPGPGPRAVLQGWRGLAPHLTAFTRAGEPYAVEDEAGLTRALLGALERPERADEVVLSREAGWRPRFALGDRPE